LGGFCTGFTPVASCFILFEISLFVPPMVGLSVSLSLFVLLYSSRPPPCACVSHRGSGLVGTAARVLPGPQAGASEAVLRDVRHAHLQGLPAAGAQGTQVVAGPVTMATSPRVPLCVLQPACRRPPVPSPTKATGLSCSRP